MSTSSIPDSSVVPVTVLIRFERSKGGVDSYLFFHFIPFSSFYVFISFPLWFTETTFLFRSNWGPLDDEGMMFGRGVWGPFVVWETIPTR